MGYVSRQYRVARPNNTTQQRKRSAHTRPTVNTNSDIPPSVDEPFRLLDLAPELRDCVYEKILEIYPVAHLSRFTSDKNLLTDCRIIAVSKQVRSEFMSIMSLHTPIIRTRVRNFDFGAVITHFNRIPAAELNKLLTDTNKFTRIMKVELDFSHRGGHIVHENIYRWLNRVDDPRKSGFGVKVQYEWVPDCWPGNRELKVYVRPRGVKGREEWDKIQNAPRIENFKEDEVRLA